MFIRKICFSRVLKCNYLNVYNLRANYTTRSITNVLESGKIGDHIEIKGWVKSLRKQKQIVFVDISDGSTAKKLQVLLPQHCKLDKLSYGASITASGQITTTPKGEKELTAENVNICGECALNEGYPFAPRKQYAAEYVRQYLHLRPRTNKFASLLRLRHKATIAIHNCLDNNGYINVHTPILTSNDCEGAGEVFKVVPDRDLLLRSMVKDGLTLEEAYFDRKVYLAVSGQLHLEAAAHGLNRVYTFGPTFRAENSKTRLHLSEFYMLEAEVAFLENLSDLLNIIENLIKNVTKVLLDTCEEDVRLFEEENKRDFSWLDKKFPILTYTESLQILQDKHGQRIDEVKGLSKQQELFLVEHFGNLPVFLINWPKEVKPFYMRECEDDASKVSALDLLTPNVGEMVGGSLRENNYEKLRKKLPEGSEDCLRWYLDLRKFGGVPTGGFGLGFERYLGFLLGISNVKDCIPFPRWPHNCDL